ncbi:hypothetical protein BKA57DRAFT_532632 [Linnemannia elongata]|nr:hypothetical protein BKA57DRAFT_532632 [Linnemannia elongata]
MESLQRNKRFGLEFHLDGSDGAQVLSETLKNNSTLTTLNLSYNSIGSNGAQALSKARNIDMDSQPASCGKKDEDSRS